MSENIITIAELEAITTAPGSSFIAVDNGTTTNKITVDNFVSSSNQTAQTYATAAESYAKGGTSSRTGEDTDNAKYYKEQAASIASTISDNIDIAEEQVTSAIDAKNLAQSASRAAESNANRAQSSQLYAAASASSASTSANAASQQATLANNAKTAAESAATDALGYKDTAVDAASDAQGYATDAERYASAASASADAAAAVAVRTPYVGANGNWYVWDAEENDFVDSGEKAQGDKGDTGNTGATPTISMTATTDAIASPNPSVTVTKSGTDSAPSFAMAFTGLKGPKGDTGNTGPDGVSPAVTISNITGGHTVTITDKDHPSGQSFDVMDGTGAGDMLSSTYDDDSTVANAGGIAEYVEGEIGEGLEDIGLIEDFSKYENAVSVKDYGAVGDGVNNDLAAFVEAFADTDYDVILIPRGTYVLTQPNPNNPSVDIELSSNKTIVGEHSSLTTLKNANIVAPYGITAKSITFDGGTKRAVHESGFPSAGTSNMQNKLVTIFATPRYSDASVVYENCVFKNTDIASLAFHGTAQSGDLPVTSLVESKAKGCVFEDITNCGIWHSVDIASAEYTENVFKNLGGSTIKAGKIWGLSLGDISNNTNKEVTDAIITGNVFNTLTTDVDLVTDTQSEDYNDINANFIAITCEKALIEYNELRNFVGYGHDHEGIYTKGNDVEIAYNLLIDCSNGGEGYICAKYKAHKLYHYRVMNIHNNTFMGEYGNAIRCYGCGVIRDNDISIRKVWRAVRGSATGSTEMTDGIMPYTFLRVENNNICCGLGTNPDDPNYVCDNLISTDGKYYGGLYFNNNSIGIYRDTNGSGSLPSVFSVNKATNDIEVIGNIVKQYVVGRTSATPGNSCIAKLFSISDSNTSLSATRTATLTIADNQCEEFAYCALQIILKNGNTPNLTYIFKIRNNYFKPLAGNNPANPIYMDLRANNNYVLWYETTQAYDAISARAQVKTTVAIIYTHMASNYFDFGTSTPTIYSDDFKDYLPIATLKTVVAASSDFADFQTRIAAL